MSLHIVDAEGKPVKFKCVACWAFNMTGRDSPSHQHRIGCLHRHIAWGEPLEDPRPHDCRWKECDSMGTGTKEGGAK